MAEKQKLPTELCENIIDCLATIYTMVGSNYDDAVNLRRDLSSCALVCRAWLTRARMYLFSNLHIEGRRLLSYERTIRSSPSICTFAREFAFWNSYVDRTKHTPFDKTLESASHAVRVVHKLPQVYRLSFGNINLNTEHPRLPDFMTALTSVTQLELSTQTPTQFIQLARLIASFRNTRVLKLQVPVIIYSYDPPLPRPRRPTHASLLALMLWLEPGTYQVIDWLLHSGIFISHLHILQLIFVAQISFPEVRLVMDLLTPLLGHCSEHLEEWRFVANIAVDKPRDLPVVSLALNARLSRLHFMVTSSWFKHVLDQLRDLKSEHITFIQVWHWFGDDESSTTNDLWSELDDILDEHKFRSHPEINVGCVRQIEGRWIGVEGFSGSHEFPYLLPKLHARGVLTWTF